MTQLESPNAPRLIRRKRYERVVSTSESSDSSDSDNDEDHDRIDPKYSKNISSPNAKNVDAQDNNDIDVYSITESSNSSVSHYEPDCDEIEPDSRKNIFSQNAKNAYAEEYRSLDVMPVLAIHDLEEKIPPWGAKINYHREIVKVTNTCSIDYLLFGLWVFFKKNNNFIALLPDLKLRHNINKIVNYIEENNWDKVREVWIVDVMNLQENPSRKTISLFGTEYERFLQFIISFQAHSILQKCDSKCSSWKKIISSQRTQIFYEKIESRIRIRNFVENNCKSCGNVIDIEYVFHQHPFGLYIESMTDNIFFNELPKQIELNGKSFELLFTTLHMPGHFIAILFINNEEYVINDLRKKAIYLPKLDVVNLLEKSQRNKLSGYFNLKTVTSFYFEVGSPNS
jgi:hypothetical protein